MFVSAAKWYGPLGAAVACVMVCGGAQAQSVGAPGGYYGEPAPVYAAPSRPLTVQRRYAPSPMVVAPYDPYRGPQAIVTAPIATAANLVALPFRVLNSVFPAYGDPAANPLVIVGAPVHAAGRIAQVPFHVLQAPFVGSSDEPY